MVEDAGSCAFFGPLLGLVFEEFAPFEGSVGFAFFCVAGIIGWRESGEGLCENISFMVYKMINKQQSNSWRILTTFHVLYCVHQATDVPA